MLVPGRAVEVAVVHRVRRLVAPCPRIYGRGTRTVPLEAEAACACEYTALDPSMPFAQAACVIILHGETRASRAAGRAVRDRRQELGRPHEILVLEAMRAAVLVLDRQHDRLEALARAEIGDERPEERRGDVPDPLGLRILASRELDPYARARVVGPQGGEVGVDVALDLPRDRVVRRHAAADVPGVRLRLRDVAEDRRDVLDVNLRGEGIVVLSPALGGVDGRGRRHDLGLDREALGRREPRTVEVVDDKLMVAGVGERDKILVGGEACREHRLVSGGDGLVFVRKRQLAGIGPIGRRDRHLDDDRRRVLDLVEADAETDPGAVVSLANHLLLDHERRAVDDVQVEGVDRRLAPAGASVDQVLVQRLDLDGPGALLREVVGERGVVDARPLGDEGVGVGLVAHGLVLPGRPVADSRPLVLEAVREVVRRIVDVGLDGDVLPLRILVLERVPVRLRLEPVDVDRVYRRRLVVDHDVDHLGRRIAGELVGGVVVLLRAEHDGERVVLPVLGTVEDREVARGGGAVYGNRAAGGRGRGDGVVSEYAGISAEHAEVDVVKREKECVDRRRRVVRRAEANLEPDGVAFFVRVVLVVGGFACRGARGGYMDVEVRDFARLAADRRLDAHLRGVVAGAVVRHRRRLAARKADECAVLAARRELLGQLDPACGRACLDLDGVAGRGVRDVRVCVVDRDVDLKVLAGGHFVRAGCRGRGYDGLRGAYPHGARHHTRHVDAARRAVRGGDRRVELDLVPVADGVGVASKRIDIQRILRRASRGNRHGRQSGTARQRLHGVLSRGEAYVVAPGLGVAVLERRRHGHGHGDRHRLGEVHGEAGLGDEVVAVRHGGQSVGLHDDARRERLDALHRDGYVVCYPHARRGGVVVVRPCAEDEVGRPVLGYALDGEAAGDAPALENDLRDLRLLDDWVVARVIACDEIHRRAVLDLDRRLVVGPHVERNRLLDRCGGVEGDRRPDRLRGVLVDAAPEGEGIGLRRLPVRREVDGANEEAALREGVVELPAATIRRAGGSVRGPEPHLRVIAVGVPDPPLVGAVELVCKIRSVGVACRAGLRGEENRRREVADLRQVGEDEVGEPVGRVGLALLQRGVCEPAGDVYPYLEGIERVIDDLRGRPHVD